MNSYNNTYVVRDYKNASDDESNSSNSEIEHILKKTEKLTMEDLQRACKYFHISVEELLRQAKESKKKRLRESLRGGVPSRGYSPDNSDTETDDRSGSGEDDSEIKNSRIRIPLPVDSPLKRSVNKKKASPLKKKSPKSPIKVVSFQRIKKIVSKKKIPKHEMKLLCIHYSIPVKSGITGVWFSAAKKGHIFVMKQLYKKGHIDEINITDDKGMTAEQIADKNKRGHIAKWLQSESIQTVALHVPKPYHFKQQYTSSEE
jgi:transcriptional regulator with XRE-family HTH domain